jgi:hypothetical protein
MPSFVLIGIPGPRWLPPFPLPVFLLRPLVWLLQGIAWLFRIGTLWIAMRIFYELRGLVIWVDTADHKQVRIWVV